MDAHHDLIFKSLHGFLADTLGSERLQRMKTILEFGSGKTGFVHKYLAPGQTGYAVDLHDYDDYWSERGVEYRKSDGQTLPFPDNSIDLVVSHSVVEHVEDLPNSLREIDRILKLRGCAYLTVSPLYYSATGSHRKELPRWEHLRPDSEHYLMEHPIGTRGSFLNKLTLSEFLGMVGSLPWNIVKCGRRLETDPLPEFLKDASWPEINLRTREFRLVAEKMAILPLAQTTGIYQRWA